MPTIHLHSWGDYRYLPLILENRTVLKLTSEKTSRCGGTIHLISLTIADIDLQTIAILESLSVHLSVTLLPDGETINDAW